MRVGLLVLVLGWIVAGASLLTTLANAPLTFEWDEWTILWGMSSGPSWLLQEHIGHFFPLGRAVYWLETRLFGLDYARYVLVNFLLLLATTFVLWRILTRLIASPLLASVLASIYVLAHGQYYNVIWALQGVWFLAMGLIAVLLLRITDLAKPVADLWNVVLILAIWLAFGSVIVAVPGLVLMVRCLRYWRDGHRIDRADLVSVGLVFVLSFELLAIGQSLAHRFPPPHTGARAPALDPVERFSKWPTIVADSTVGYGFFATAPLTPGALDTYRQRSQWGEMGVWLAAHSKGLSLALLLGLAALAGVAGVVLQRPDGSVIPRWLASTGVLVWFPVTITCIARSGIYGPPLTPRYDTWLVFGSLIAVCALLQQHRSQPRTQHYAGVIRGVVLSALAVHATWLALSFGESLRHIAAPREVAARDWIALRGLCPDIQSVSARVIPSHLQPELTARQYCWIIEDLSARTSSSY